MTRGTSRRAAVGAISGSESPQTSFIMETPASTAASATDALYVSTDTGTSNDGITSDRMGISLRSSSSAEILSAPGRVDSAPMSIMSAPSCRICMVRAAISSSLCLRLSA